MPFFSRPRRSTAVERRPVGNLSAFGFFRLPRGVPRRLLPEAYQSSSQRSISTTVKSGISTLQKRRSVKLLDYQFEYFRLPCGLLRRTRHCRSRAGERHGMCELTHGMGAAWARHAMCDSALKVPFRKTKTGQPCIPQEVWLKSNFCKYIDQIARFRAFRIWKIN